MINCLISFSFCLTVSIATNEDVQVTEIQGSSSAETLEEEQINSEPLEEQTVPMNTLSYDLNASNFVQQACMSPYQQDLQGHIMCISADFPLLNHESQEQILPQHQNYYGPENQLLSENLLYTQSSPSVSNDDGHAQHYGNNYNASMPHNFLSENGSLLMENEKSKKSGFVSSNLQEWGFSHPLGEILKNKRGMSCCFILHSGNIW